METLPETSTLGTAGIAAAACGGNSDAKSSSVCVRDSNTNPDTNPLVLPL